MLLAPVTGLKPNEIPVGLYASAFYARVNANDRGVQASCGFHVRLPGKSGQDVWYHILSWYKCCWSDPQARPEVLTAVR